MDADWQPIESAPRDGSEVLICWNFHDQWYTMIGAWQDRAFHGAHWAQPPSCVAYAPTDLPLLWRELPSPPDGEWAYSDNNHISKHPSPRSGGPKEPPLPVET